MEEKALRSHHKLTSTHQYEEDNNEGQRKASPQALDFHCSKDLCLWCSEDLGV